MAITAEDSARPLPPIQHHKQFRSIYHTQVYISTPVYQCTHLHTQTHTHVHPFKPTNSLNSPPHRRNKILLHYYSNTSPTESYFFAQLPFFNRYHHSNSPNWPKIRDLRPVPFLFRGIHHSCPTFRLSANISYAILSNPSPPNLPPHPTAASVSFYINSTTVCICTPMNTYVC